jgi:hypothetical protein
MLINQLLLSVGIKNNGKIVKPLYHALKLKAIGKVYSNSYVFLPHLIQKYILQIDISLVHLKILLNRSVLSLYKNTDISR